MRTTSTIRIAAFGTSLTAKGTWQGLLVADIESRTNYKVDIRTVALAGASSAWGVLNIDTVRKTSPDIVLVEFSINDAALNRFMSRRRSRSNITLIIDKLLENIPAPRIFLMTMNPTVGIHRWHRPLLHRYYDLYRAVAAEAGVGLIDGWNAWSKLRPNDLINAMPDGRHPTKESERDILVPIIYHAIAPLLSSHRKPTFSNGHQL